MNYVRPNNLSLKYERFTAFTPSGCTDMGIQKFEFVEKTEFLCLEMSLNRNAWKSQIFPKITINKLKSKNYDSNPTPSHCCKNQSIMSPRRGNQGAETLCKCVCTKRVSVSNTEPKVCTVGIYNA